ncbi:MAG: sugar phosphate nucleotidyltransferase [Christensenellaceae bacterium]
MNTTLVVMAAGMGSRFGGLKQAEPVTDDGKGILDFSVHDAKAAGFEKAVFIVREDMKEDFKQLIGDRIAKTIDVEYVLQDMKDLPAGRTKPFGTGHAILCCKDVVKEPFAIINADDYYGHNAFFEIRKHLAAAKKGEYAMTAYLLENTLSKNGTVSRGVCETENGFLKKVTEITKIAPDGSIEKEGERIVLPGDTPVSMNLWGLRPIFSTFSKRTLEIPRGSQPHEGRVLYPQRHLESGGYGPRDGARLQERGQMVRHYLPRGFAGSKRSDRRIYP